MLELYDYIRKIFFMNNKKIAVIDLGTNTFHLLIVKVEGKDFDILVRERISVRIGKSGINKGVITENAQLRALQALREFKAIIDLHHVEKVYATATSAIRNAENGEELKEKIKKETSIDINIITGDEEAEFIYYGVKTALSIGSQTSLIMDIGGGSVEFIICNENTIFWKQSFEIGAQRLLDLFHYHDPIYKEEIVKLNEYLQERLQPLSDAVAIHKPKVLIGSSGTFDTLVEINSYKTTENRNLGPYESTLPLDEYYLIHHDFISKPKDERMLIRGMIEMRVEMIVVASLLIKFVLEQFSLQDIRVSAFSLKEGVLYSIINSLKK